MMGYILYIQNKAQGLFLLTGIGIYMRVCRRQRESIESHDKPNNIRVWSASIYRLEMVLRIAVRISKRLIIFCVLYIYNTQRERFASGHRRGCAQITPVINQSL